MTTRFVAATVTHMRRRTLVITGLLAGTLLLSSCGSDDQLGTFQPAFAPLSPPVVNETSEINFDLAAAQAAADSVAAAAGPADTPVVAVPIEIPDGAIDMTGQSEITIDVKDNAFVQRVVVVTEGTRITWVNRGLNAHNVTPSIDGAFEPIPTGSLDSNQSASRTFSLGGDFPYYCSLHGTPRHGQNGLIVVVPAA